MDSAIHAKFAQNKRFYCSKSLCGIEDNDSFDDKQNATQKRIDEERETKKT